MRTRPSIALAAGIAVSLGLAAAARADIAPPPPPHLLYPPADIVLTGRVASVGEASIRVTVDEVLKGRPGTTIEVGPIFEPTCCPQPGSPAPFFSVGQRVLVAARAGKEHWEFVDYTLWSTRMDDDHPNAWTGSVAVAREMLRIAALATPEERRAAMVVHLRSDSNRLVDAAVWFQFAELDSPEKSGPHVAGLVAALRAPLVDGRKAAARALIGLTPPEAVAPLIALSRSVDADEAGTACATLAPYDRKDAVEAVIAAKGVRFLGASPRPEAYATMLERLRRPETDPRREAYAAFAARFRRQAPTDAEVDEFVAILRKGAAPTGLVATVRGLPSALGARRGGRSRGRGGAAAGERGALRGPHRRGGRADAPGLDPEVPAHRGVPPCARPRGGPRCLRDPRRRGAGARLLGRAVAGRGQDQVLS
jgi:hypothetical protein